jgi:hypothetical protein
VRLLEFVGTFYQNQWFFMGKAEGKRPLGRPRRRWENNIKIDHGEIGSGDMDWIDLAQDRDQWKALVNTAVNPWVV